MRHVAERTAPGAHIAQYHKGSRAFAETFADVRAGGFLTDRHQAVLAQQFFDIVVAGAAGRLDAYPLRFTQPLLQGDDFDRIARCLRRAGLLVGYFTHTMFFSGGKYVDGKVGCRIVEPKSK